MARKTHTDLSDAELVQALQEGELSAFDTLMGRHAKRVYAVACRYLGSGEDAADVTQEVFVKIHRHIGTFTGRSQLTTWIHRIVVNTAIGALRKQGRQVETMALTINPTPTEEEGPAIDPADTRTRNPREALEDREWDALLQEKLMDLPEAYRMAFILREMRQMSYEEMAEVLEVPIGTVRSRLHHARQRLKKMLTPFLKPATRKDESVRRAPRTVTPQG